jgi:RAB protein geranylgeranyltransferase component A
VVIPFSKSEIFMSDSLSLKEKRQLVKVIGFCLNGYDLLAGTELTSKIINSTRAYEKLDTTLSKEDIAMLLDFKDLKISEFLEKLGLQEHL